MHERSLDSDFLLIILRDALKANPALRVVLMSATLDRHLLRLLWRRDATSHHESPATSRLSA